MKNMTLIIVYYVLSFLNMFKSSWGLLHLFHVWVILPYSHFPNKGMEFLIGLQEHKVTLTEVKHISLKFTAVCKWHITGHSHMWVHVCLHISNVFMWELLSFLCDRDLVVSFRIPNRFKKSIFWILRCVKVLY